MRPYGNQLEDRPDSMGTQVLLMTDRLYGKQSGGGASNNEVTGGLQAAMPRPSPTSSAVRKEACNLWAPFWTHQGNCLPGFSAQKLKHGSLAGSFLKEAASLSLGEH